MKKKKKKKKEKEKPEMGLTVVVLVAVLCGIVCSSDAPPPIIPWKSFGAVVGPAKPEVMEKRQRFFDWLKEVGCYTGPFEWRDEGVAG